MTDLTGKVALVTGASSGLGAATAKLFAERGATVFGIARDTDRMAAVFADVPGGAYKSVDIASPQACRDAVAACVEKFGRLDVLVNAAGLHQMRHTATMTDGVGPGPRGQPDRAVPPVPRGAAAPAGRRALVVEACNLPRAPRPMSK